MRKLVISKNIRLIGSGAFNNCTGLRQVTLPGRLSLPWVPQFYKCSSLTTVKLPASMRSIGLNLFDSCKSLTQVSFANGIRSLPTSTFNHCQGLRTVKLPSTLTYIGKKAFYECVSLTQITIGFRHKYPSSILFRQRYQLHRWQNNLFVAWTDL